MKTVDCCFICNTPYQIIAASALTVGEELCADLYVVPLFDHAEECVKRIRKETIFHDVILVDLSVKQRYLSNKRGQFARAAIAASYFEADKIVEGIVKNRAVYKRIFMSSKEFYSRLFKIYYEKHSIADVVFFDDGEGSYDSQYTYECSKLDRLLRGILFGQKTAQPAETKYLYCPELYRHLNRENGTIKPLPSFSENPELKMQIHRIFGANKEIDEDVIILGLV